MAPCHIPARYGITKRAMKTIDRIAYPLDEGIDAIGISRSGAYRAIRAGELRTYLEGRRRMVTRRALEEYVAKREREGQGGKKAAA